MLCRPGWSTTPRFPTACSSPPVATPQIVAVRGVGDYERLGTTLDDAIGEAFDKTAKLLGLPLSWRSGSREARQEWRPAALQPATADDRDATMQIFSLSGLKTAVRLEAENIAPLGQQDDRRSVRFVSACGYGCRLQPGTGRPDDFQSALRQAQRTRRGRRRCRKRNDPAGARHGRTRSDQFDWLCRPPALCTDNGAMIAWAGAERLELGLHRWT